MKLNTAAVEPTRWWVGDGGLRVGSAGGKKKIKKKDKLQLLQGMQAGLGARAAANGSSAAHTGPTPASLRKVAGAGAVREGAAAQPPLPVGAGEDEDIFADAGTDYVVERRQGQRAQGSSAAVPPPPSGSRYFSQLEDAADLPPLPAGKHGCTSHATLALDILAAMALSPPLFYKTCQWKQSTTKYARKTWG